MISRPLDSTERALVEFSKTQPPRKPNRHSIILAGKWPQVQQALRDLQARGLDHLVSRGWQ